MDNRLIIIGAGGHGKVIADIAMKNGYTDICFVDDNATGDCMGFPIIGSSSAILSLNDGKTDFIAAIGNNEVRQKIADKFDVNWVTLIHPSAQIATGVTIGCGTVVMPGAVINVCATIGKHCIINTCAVVEHDNSIEDFVHISPGVRLAGAVMVGAHTWIGVGASVVNNVAICSNCVIGAGTVVVKDMCDSGTYVGVPARKIK